MKKTESAAKPTLARGKYANLLKQGTNVVILERALRAFLAINDQVQSAATRVRGRRRPAASAAAEFDPRVGVQPRQAAR
jgi:hypothetical protein